MKRIDQELPGDQGKEGWQITVECVYSGSLYTITLYNGMVPLANMLLSRRVAHTPSFLITYTTKSHIPCALESLPTT